jgi:hypothetical protein
VPSRWERAVTFARFRRNACASSSMGAPKKDRASSRLGLPITILGFFHSIAPCAHRTRDRLIANKRSGQVGVSWRGMPCFNETTSRSREGSYHNVELRRQWRDAREFASRSQGKGWHDRYPVAARRERIFAGSAYVRSHFPSNTHNDVVNCSYLWVRAFRWPVTGVVP